MLKQRTVNKVHPEQQSRGRRRISRWMSHSLFQLPHDNHLQPGATVACRTPHLHYLASLQQLSLDAATSFVAIHVMQHYQRDAQQRAD